MQINECKLSNVSYVLAQGSLVVDFESQSNDPLAALMAGGNFRARFFMRRYFQPMQQGEVMAQVEMRAQKAAADYKQALTAALGQDGTVSIAHAIFTVTELSGGSMNAVAVRRSDGTSVVMSSLTRDQIVTKGTTATDELRAQMLADAKSVFMQGLSNGRYTPAQAVYQTVTVGPAQQAPVNPLAGLQAAPPEQQQVPVGSQPGSQGSVQVGSQPQFATQQAPAF